MSDPFASLLLNGVKTIETRNSAVLANAGTGPCLLHIGRKLWPNSDYMEELWRMGIPERDWPRLTEPRRGFRRGSIAGVVELGATRQGSAADFDSDDTRRAVVARKENMGRFLTPVKNAQWLERPIPMGGRPGIWTTWVWRKVLPPGILDLLPKGQEDENDSGQAGLAMTADLPRPRLVVFDLDGCLWHPEMYQTSGGPPYRPIGRSGRRVENSAGEEIRLLQGAREALRELADAEGVTVAVASSSYAEKALPLLDAFEVKPGVRIRDVLGDNLVEIYYRRSEGKRPHFEALREKSGVPYDAMLFFDDAQDNVATVASLGVVCEHTPDGLSSSAWASGLRKYARSRGAGGRRSAGKS
mmetsp:Transcript_109668/g.309316  ORF Transcript_109668/g.309316 Transcript_109668/m.309316 type:complete len:357 (+) Transcript_109668:3-1073(+)